MRDAERDARRSFSCSAISLTDLAVSISSAVFSSGLTRSRRVRTHLRRRTYLSCDAATRVE